MTPPFCFYLGKIKTVVVIFTHILFSSIFALAAEGYTIPHQQRLLEEQNETLKYTQKLRYFTQRLLYNLY